LKFAHGDSRRRNTLGKDVFAESLTGALGKEPDGANTVFFAKSSVKLSANLGLCREL